MDEKIYTIAEIKAAYWKEFHAEGEMFFDYLGTDEENEDCTEAYWASFLWYLRGDDG